MFSFLKWGLGLIFHNITLTFSQLTGYLPEYFSIISYIDVYPFFLGGAALGSPCIKDTEYFEGLSNFEPHTWQKGKKDSFCFWSQDCMRAHLWGVFLVLRPLTKPARSGYVEHDFRSLVWSGVGSSSSHCMGQRQSCKLSSKFSRYVLFTFWCVVLQWNFMLEIYGLSIVGSRIPLVDEAGYGSKLT